MKHQNIFQVQILKSLNDHPNIVQVIDFFVEKEHYFLVLELMRGGELFDRIVEKQFYNEKEVCGIYYDYRFFVALRVLATNASCILWLFNVYITGTRCAQDPVKCDLLLP